MLLWFVPFGVLITPVLLLSEPGMPITLTTDWRTVELTLPVLAGWVWLLGSLIWVIYSLWRILGGWVRGLRAGWLNRDLPPVDD